MKKLMIGIILLLVSLTTVAEAGTYVVKKGQCLSVIGQELRVKWRAIADLNDIKAPWTIYPNQKLKTPERGAGKKAVKVEISAPVERPVKYWDSFNTDPYGDQDPVQAINDFDLPEPVKEIAVDMIVTKGVPGQDMTINRGHHFEQMRFGHGMWNNVVARLANHPEMESFNAEVWTISHGASVYYIAKPKDCINWSWWWVGKVPQQPEKKVEAHEKKMMMLLPLPPPLVRSLPVTPGIIGEIEKIRAALEAEGYAWTGYFIGPGGGYSYYYGGKGILYFSKNFASTEQDRLGVGVTGNWWNGITSRRFHFNGDRWTVGPVYDITNSQGTRVTVTVQLGKQTDHGFTEAGFKTRQETDVLYLGLTLDAYEVGPFYKIETWLDAIADMGHEKSSTFRGFQIPVQNDPAASKNSLSWGARWYWWGQQPGQWKGGLTTKLDWVFDGHSFGQNFGPFITDPDYTFKVGLEGRNVMFSEFPDNNGVFAGITFDLDIGKTLIKAGKYLANGSTKKLEEKNHEEVNNSSNNFGSFVDVRPGLGEGF